MHAVSGSTGVATAGHLGGPTMQGAVTVATPPNLTMSNVASVRRPRPEDSALHITVSDPVQHSEGMNKYTSYRVDVRPTGAEGNNNNPSDASSPTNDPNSIFQNTSYSAVLRRYSDFLWLYERLHQERAGSIVPPLPEKQAVARFSSAFVEDRRSKLELFLRRVHVHPELRDAPSLDAFLRADDSSFQAAKSVKKGARIDGMMSGGGGSVVGNASPYVVPSAPPTAKKEGFKGWFAEMKTSLSGDLVRSPDDDLFEEIERYIAGLDAQMKSVSMQASALVRKGKEIANGLFEFGLAFALLGRSEADELGTALVKMGECADSLSVLSAEHAELEMKRFEDPLQDYIKTIHSVKQALNRRHEKRLTYTTCLSEVSTKQAQLAKLRATPGNEGKAYGAEMSLRRATEAADAARDDFATVGQRVLREVDRFKREKADEMRCTVLDYITLQVEYNRKMEEAWTKLIPQLERASQTGGGAGASVAVSSGNTAVSDSASVAGGATSQPQQQQQQQQTPQQQQIPADNVSMPSQQQHYGVNPVMGGVMGGATGGVQYRPM